METLGCSAGASRMTTGNLPVYAELEAALARFFGVASATLTSAGYLAPMVAVQALAGDRTDLLLDERAHACLRDAAALTGLPMFSFPHRDPEGLAGVVRGLGRKSRVLVLTDGLFTHSGGVAPLAAYLDRLPSSAVLMVDDAHGFGVLGRRGRGSVEWTSADPRRLVLTGTLSKAIGAYGGVVLGDAALRTRILRGSRMFTGNTPLPPPCAAAAMAALAVLRREGEARRARLQSNLARLRQAVREAAGADLGDGPGPMVVLAPARPAAVTRLKRRLLDAGIYPPFIRYPNGPAERFFRFALSSEHTGEQVALLGEVLAEALRRAT